MNTPSRVAATLSLAVLVGGGGYWAGTNNLASVFGIDLAETALARPAGGRPSPTGAVIYYRHPDGLPQFSATPKNVDDGRPFVAVHASEDVSFEDNAKAPTVTAAAGVAPEAAPSKGRILYYRNPMGLPDTSKAPKKDSMGMDYIPVYAGEQSDASTVKVSLGKLQRTGVKTASAEMASISRKIQVPGTVALDERLVSIISMRTDSFVDDVADVTTGARIGKGEKLFRFYSKDIATAASEYAARVNGDAGPTLRLKNLGVPQEVIDDIARTREVPASMTYTAPRDGIVLERSATAGMMAKSGDVLFRIADISNVWVVADVPEYDLTSVRIGASADVVVRSLPGRTFKGVIDLIYPEVETQTRTTKVRIEIPNPDGALLPNMYAEVQIEAGAPNPVVAVPNSAVIDTGDRQVVFVDKGEGRFEPKDVTLGVRGEDKTEISKGIAVGDKVVIAANFLLDAESNLNSALSAMTSEETKP
ncbi:efflux RND transporter periplasmic adaptor subunit [Rhizobium leguminosarum]|uniref:efflux RND transporter periplasmic adaptor subunit n=1 Tax=Rhizobium leguminosarum TaxID=384 RepID=UPI0017EE5DEC|nr:efflux RND transporter periplasmic adaptor subunit [Rhizobium leguminosarum]MBB4331655.1 Cu(I)/Ag(I) efflux system membrane fusion protein [Rhizobium leguminosarum]MBB4357066.1 Cu(I)/Ag(I) efflux system membrane fusion protein [Rhizobium leguminosarum]MBB4551626.1 Cu(I)/Ag(I) efflux system membrane fusion protein [Rhizobium leguminosarum]MBB4564219.1 Cu(I)/Ag(I) efflux system membrane fusion protein [Rhizobium leguminosarum]